MKCSVSGGLDASTLPIKAQTVTPLASATCVPTTFPSRLVTGSRLTGRTHVSSPPPLVYCQTGYSRKSTRVNVSTGFIASLSLQIIPASTSRAAQAGDLAVLLQLDPLRHRQPLQRNRPLWSLDFLFRDHLHITMIAAPTSPRHRSSSDETPASREIDRPRVARYVRPGCSGSQCGDSE